MKSRNSFFTLILPTLMFVGLHFFVHTHEVAASFHHDRTHFEVHESAFFHDHRQAGKFFHKNFLHGASHDFNFHPGFFEGKFTDQGTHDFNHHFFHPVATNGRNRTFEKGQWWDEQARQDMRARIARNGADWTPETETFGKQSNWLPGWELRWWSFRSNDGRSVWVYHARSKANGQRYTSLADNVSDKLQEWKPAR